MHRIEFGETEVKPVQGLWADLVHVDLAHLRQQRQTDGADTGVKFGDSRARRDLLAHVLDDALCDVEIALPECARRVMHRSSAKVFNHALRAAPVFKVGAEDGVGALAISIEPEAVKF